MKQIFILTALIIYFSVQIQQHLSLQRSLLYIPEETKYSKNIEPTQRKIKIAIVDTEVNWKDPLLYPYMKDQNLPSIHLDKFDHATMVSSMLIYTLNQVYGEKAKDLFEVRVFSYEFYENGAKNVDNEPYFKALDKAITWNPDILNISVETARKDFIEEILINYALLKNIKVIAAAGNFGDSGKIYPCAFNGVVCVGATNKVSNFGDQVSIIVKKSSFDMRNATGKIISNRGTSFAAPIVASYYASLMINKDSSEYFDKKLNIKNQDLKIRNLSTYNQ